MKEMRKFLLNILGFAVLCVAAMFLVELYLLNVPNRYSYKYNYIKNHKNEIQVLLLGSCHIEDDLNPKLLGEHTFNAAISGREEVYDADLIKQFVPQMKNLKVLVMPLEYRDFAMGRGKKNPRDLKKHGGFQSTFKCMYYKYMNIHIDPFWYWSEILNSELNYKERIHMTYAQQIETDSLGFVQLLDANKIDKWEYWDLPSIYDMSLPIDSSKYQQIFEIYHTAGKICADNGVRLILTSLPMYKTYQEDLNPAAEREKRDFVKRIQKEFPTVEYYSFMRDERFLPEDFHDASHLSESGAPKFSKIFKEIIDGNPSDKLDI